VFALDVIMLAALAIAVWRFGGGDKGTKAPADEPVPENL
jgi:hypothetical protein